MLKLLCLLELHWTVKRKSGQIICVHCKQNMLGKQDTLQCHLFTSIPGKFKEDFV